VLPNWFSTVEANFAQHLTPLAGRSDLDFLQIGAYAGHCTEWLCTNVLTGVSCLLTDVDTWGGSPDEAEHSALDWYTVREEYFTRIRPFGHTVHTFMGASDVFFMLQGPAPSTFDFVYVDGGHRAENVLRDAVHADCVLKPGGILAFDDYLWWENEGKHPAERPKVAINAFWTARKWDYDILSWDYQVWLRKRNDAGAKRG
jgi:SAM-dependent methyltransferase